MQVKQELVISLNKAIDCIKKKNWLELNKLISASPEILDLTIAQTLNNFSSHFEIAPTLLYYIQQFLDETKACEHVFINIMQDSNWELTDLIFANTPFTYAVATGNTHAINLMFNYIKESKPELLTKENQNWEDAKNTPLLLAIKNADKETAHTLIPYYKKEDLLCVSSQRNSALHLACYTKMHGIVLAIVERAQEIGCIDEVLTQLNGKLFTAYELYKAQFTRPRGYFKNNVYVMGREIHLHLTEFYEEIGKHRFNYEMNSDKDVNQKILESLSPSPERALKQAISVDTLISMYETPETSDENKAWIAIPDSKKGTIIPKIQGDNGGDFDNGWKVHISVDPLVIDAAALLIAKILNMDGMPRVCVQFAGKELAQSGQASKQVALCFYEDELENTEKIAQLLNTIEMYFYINGIRVDDRKINSNQKDTSTTWDACILDELEQPTRFNYRNENCTVLEDCLFSETANELKNGLPSHYVVVKDNYILQDKGAQVKQSYYLAQRNYGNGHCPVEFHDLTVEEKQNDNAKYFKDPFEKITIKSIKLLDAEERKNNLDWNILTLKQKATISQMTPKEYKVPSSDYWATLSLSEREALLEIKNKSSSNVINNSMFFANNIEENSEKSKALVEKINTKLGDYYTLIDKEKNAIFYTNEGKITLWTSKCNVLLAAREVLNNQSSILLKQAEEDNVGWEIGKEAVVLVNEVKNLKNIPLNWDDLDLSMHGFH